MARKILVAQGGGPTAVINQSLIGVAMEARRFPDISHVYGALHGVRGIVNEEMIDLGLESASTSRRSPSPRPRRSAPRGTSRTANIARKSSRS